MASLSTPRFLHGMTIDSTSKGILVVGGSSDNGVLDSVEEFHHSKERWSYGESFPGNRCAQYVTEFGGEILAVGGYITERFVEPSIGIMNSERSSSISTSISILQNGRREV